MLKSRGSQAIVVGVAGGIMAIVLNHVTLSIWWQVALVFTVLYLVALGVQAVGRR